MKKTLPLVLVAALTFLLVWLVLRNADEDQPGLRPNRSPFAPSEIDPARLRVRDPAGFEGVVTRSEKIPDARREAGRGAIRITAVLPDGKEPEGLEVLAQPPLPAGARLDRGLRFDQVDVGSYRITVHGIDIVPVVQRAVTVKDGEVTELNFKVVRGIRPRGVVLDAEDDRPLAGVRIDFNGLARAVSGPDGRFDVPMLLPRSALDVISLEGDTYDFQKYRGLLVPDPGDMRLHLGGGKGILIGQIVNASGQPLPEDGLLRMTAPPLYDLRREIRLDGRTTFRLENLYPGEFRIELHCPGGEFPMTWQMVDIPNWEPDRMPEAAVELRLEAGATLEGRILGEPSHLVGLRFELRDRRNHKVSVARLEEGLEFRFRNLREGSYFPVLTTSNAEMRMPPVEIEGLGTIRRDLDVKRRRWSP